MTYHKLEQSADQKHKPHYLGPFLVVRWTRGGSYVIAEMDDAISQQGIAASQLLPYLSREQIEELYWHEEDDSEEEDNQEIEEEYKGEENEEEMSNEEEESSEEEAE